MENTIKIIRNTFQTNNNIRVHNLRSKNCEIYDDNQWKDISTNEILNDILTPVVDDLEYIERTITSEIKKNCVYDDDLVKI